MNDSLYDCGPDGVCPQLLHLENANARLTNELTGLDVVKAERDELRERVRELEDRSLTWNRLCVDLKNQNAKLRAALEAREAVIEHYRDCDACMSGQKCDEGFRLQSGNMARQRRKRS